MSLSSVNILRSDGNILANPTGNDGVSGFVFYTLESGATSTPAYYKLIELADALALDITTTDTVIYYQIEQYFSKSNYPLYVCIVDREISNSDTFVEVSGLQYFAEGEIRQMAILNSQTAIASAQITALQVVAESLEDEFMPVQLIYLALFAGDGDVDSVDLFDLTSLNASRVSVMIGEDKVAGGKSETLYDAGAELVSELGLLLGVLASSPVNENCGYVANHNISDSIVEPGFVDNTLNKSKSRAKLNVIDNKKYLFFVKHTGLQGTYFNYDYTACDPTLTDFSSISLNRVYDKAFRVLRSSYLPALNSTVYVDGSGKLSDGAVKYYENLGVKALEALKSAGEISDFSVDVDPNQLILVTKQLNVVAKLVPTGTAKVISVKLGFSLSL